MAVKLDEHFVKAISDEEMEYVRTWLETDFKNQGCRNGMFNHWDIIKKAQRDGDLYGYCQDGKIEGIEVCYKRSTCAYLELICVNPENRRRGIGYILQQNTLKYMRSRRCLVAELYNVSEEGALLSSKNGFIPLNKVADDKNWKYKPLVERRPSSNNANRLLGLWKDQIGEKEKQPDMTWSLDFSIDNRPIIEYVCKDWHLGIIENGEVTDFSVAKRFHHILSNEHDYLIINSDIF